MRPAKPIAGAYGQQRARARISVQALRTLNKLLESAIAEKTAPQPPQAPKAIPTAQAPKVNPTAQLQQAPTAQAPKVNPTAQLQQAPTAQAPKVNPTAQLQQAPTAQLQQAPKVNPTRPSPIQQPTLTASVRKPEPKKLIFRIVEPNLVQLPSPLTRSLIDANVGSEQDLKNYDWSTLFYDVWVKKQTLWMIGPPLLNLEEISLTAVCEKELELSLEKVTSVSDKVSLWTAPLGAQSSYPVSIRFAHAKLSLDLLDTEEKRRPRRILVTLQKNNKIAWIADWIAWYANNYGINQVILYDNNSEYQESLAERLAEVLTPRLQTDKLQDITIVPWNVPYGMIVNYNHKNFFSQHGSLNHAARRFAQKDDQIFNFDIDELLNCPRNALDQLLRENQLLLVDSFWVPFIDGLPVEYSFRNFKHREPMARGTCHKWIFVWDGNAHLCIHNILNRRAYTIPAEVAHYLHYKGITTYWKSLVFRKGAAKQEIEHRYSSVPLEGLVPIIFLN